MRNCNNLSPLHLAVVAVCTFVSSVFLQNCKNCKLHGLQL
ncbi:hypothetical protein BACCOP_04059 [Phocaeicola coprocola DSM 17136]|uniref:Uncharacterized protein n=1 Tax=Phocaeicola coprocola DSM 17136 TaxID=470145 RepID=B3JQ27_9BACT|nr:hypothetical protein BACCOP_04059 [Phocaeicola coprocola DSM 17136]